MGPQPLAGQSRVEAAARECTVQLPSGSRASSGSHVKRARKNTAVIANSLVLQKRKTQGVCGEEIFLGVFRGVENQEMFVKM